MKTKYRCLHSSILKFLQGGLTATLAIVLLAIPVAGNAQETTATIRGKILDTSGSEASSASIVVEDLRSGVTRSYSTNNSGVFLATRLLPGGPYEITVNGTQSVAVPSVSVGSTYNLTINLQAEQAIEEIIAIGQASELVTVATGPSATFNLADLENSVSFSRDITDVYGIDPRMNIDTDDDGQNVNCGGKHPRFNATTLDGVSQGDRFGLNDNGYSTAVGMPFPYDAIEQVAIELAPFDVTYGGFSACIINSVTKSGTNEWEAKAFYEFSDQSLRGDTVTGDSADYTRPDYDKTYMGFSVGGPIIKDKLFVFAAYEDFEVPRFLAKGYDGSGNGEERGWLSQADYDRIASIANNVYNYDPGGQPGDGSQEGEKYMVRLDWNISDDHNAALIYNYFDGFQDRDSDGDDNEFEFANHYYQKGAESETITLKLSSQWTDAFSSEVFFSSNEMNDSQVTVGPKDFADMQISIGGRDGTVYVGADDSRQANSLATDVTYLKLAANYLVGDHVITAGYDREDLEIFNIFLQHSNGGEYDYFDDSSSNAASCAALTAQERFDEVDGCEPSGIDRFELGRPSRIYYGSNGGTNVASDAAARFSNVLNSLYVQDEIFIDNADLTITAGVRYEWFDSNDAPIFNQAFTDANGGLRNDVGLNGLDLLMPRLGFKWGLSDDVTLRGGIGLYSGGNPNVWISNAWSNDGVSNVQTGGWDEDEFFPCANNGWPDYDPEVPCGGLDGDVNTLDPSDGFTILPGSADSLVLSDAQRPGFDVPQSMVDYVLNTSAADAATSNLVIIDPNYEQPSEWKLALGATWDLANGMTLDFDYLRTKGDNPAYYQDLSQTIVGTTAAGSPIYDFTNGRDNHMLTNSNESPESSMMSLVLRKDFDFGLSATIGYARTDGEDVAPMTSATAFSNYDNTALLDINNPGAANSNWVVPQRFTMALFYEHAFFGDAMTRISLQAYAHEGQPQSYVMQGSDLEGDGFYGRHLLYVPTGTDDPNVEFDWDSPLVAAEFWAFVEREGLKPGFTKRNAFNTGWTQTMNLSIRQEIPMGDSFRGNLYFKVRNLGNLLNDRWGKVTDAQFFSPQVIDAGVNDEGQFVFEDFHDRSIQRTYIGPSLWEVRVGLDVRFGQ